MRTMIERSLLTGIGLLSLTREKAHAIVDDLVQRDEAKDMVDRLIKRGKEERKSFRNLISDEVAKGLKGLDLVTKKDLQKLSKKIDALNKEA